MLIMISTHNQLTQMIHNHYTKKCKRRYEYMFHDHILVIARISSTLSGSKPVLAEHTTGYIAWFPLLGHVILE